MLDLGSTNGTYLGTVRVTDVTLAGGETLRMGGTSVRVERLPGPRPPAMDTRTGFGKLLGASREMRRLFPLLDRLAGSDVPVLIEGETGTGKEVLAEALHEASRRRDQPFVVFDCTTVPGNLVESALFGHEKGAFTGAISARPGVFEQANGGTLLIDEIGDLELALQPKLLRALQRSEVQRVGGQKWTKVDVRILAATRRDLDKEVQAGRFRDDLYYRINVARVELPPLRRREGDITRLAREFCRLMGGDEGSFDGAVLARFEDYTWPGNVRELYNAVARFIALGDLASFEPRAAQPSTPAPDVDFIEQVLETPLGLIEARERVVRELERRYLEKSLERHGGNITRAAEAARIGRRYFHQLLLKTRRDPETP